MIEGIFAKMDDKRSLIKEIWQKAGWIPDNEPNAGAICAIITVDGEGVAVGCLEGSLIRDVAVITEKRGMSYGDLAAKMLIDKAFRQGERCLKAECGEDAAGFFERIGFKITEKNGDKYKISLEREELIKCKHK